MKTELNQVSAEELEQNLDEILGQVESRRDSILIERDGETAAVLVSAEMFEKIRGWLDKDFTAPDAAQPQSLGATEPDSV